MLDCGCGDGIHAEVLRTMFPDANYVGIDISQESIFSAKQKVPEYEFRVEDISTMSYKDNSFDVVMSYGVVAYTTDPIRTIQEIIRVTKPGGIIAIWMCAFDHVVTKLILQILRGVSHVGNGVFMGVVSNALVPFLSFVSNDSGVNLFNSTWKQCREVIEVNLAPPVLGLYTKSELSKLYKDLENIKMIDSHFARCDELWAKKKL